MSQGLSNTLRRQAMRYILTAAISITSIAAIAQTNVASDAASKDAGKSNRPNIIVIMSDDMGISDIGCYGSEIETPRLDKLASEGVRFTQFYNMARCCPSRAALLTGLAPHQAGVGHMLMGYPGGPPGYSDHLSTDSVTMGEVMKSAGYNTYMVGKWHVARAISPDGPKDSWPLQRGFNKFYGIITGAGNYYDPATLCRGNSFITVENDPEYKPENYYFTDAITDNAIKFIDENEKASADDPFFMYVAYTAAHWPMQAPADEVAKQKGKYDTGYAAIRDARFEKMKKLEIIREDLTSSPIVSDWTNTPHHAWEARNMEVYAAMIHRMDTGIGRIIDKLEKEGELDNTLIMFMQDNGACAEGIARENRTDYPTDLKPMGPDEFQTKIWPPMQTRDGRPVRTGPDTMPGPADTYTAYGEDWANVSNTPFRKYKHWVHEGGIATPLIAHWPAGIDASRNNSLVREPTQIIDIMATVADAGGAEYPEEYNGYDIKPLAGVSLLPLFRDQKFDRGGPLFWEHESNRAVRDGKWKIVAAGPGPWELYDMSVDRAEMNNLAGQHPEIVKRMAAQWQEWAEANDVLPLGTWEVIQKKRQRGENEPKTENTTFRLKAGERLNGDDRPPLADREFSVVARIKEWGDNGVIVSQGGSQQGWALYSKDGQPCFALRRDAGLAKVEDLPPIPVGKPVVLRATLKQDGTVTFRAGKKTGQPLRVEAPLNLTPGEGVTVGNDHGGLVGDYPKDFEFNGKVNRIVIRVSEDGGELKTPVSKKGKKKHE